MVKRRTPIKCCMNEINELSNELKIYKEFFSERFWQKKGINEMYEESLARIQKRTQKIEQK